MVAKGQNPLTVTVTDAELELKRRLRKGRSQTDVKGAYLRSLKAPTGREREIKGATRVWINNQYPCGTPPGVGN